MSHWLRGAPKKLPLSHKGDDMQWSDIRTDLAAVAPGLGAVIGGPVGAGVGKLVAVALGTDSTPDAVSQALKIDPDAAIKLRQIDATVQVAQITAAATQQAAVNQTLQTEAMGGDYWQRNHHAFESSFVVLLITGIYFVLPLLNTSVPTVPGEVWLMLGAVLGVTAWQRGQANVTVASGGNNQ